MRPRRRRDGWRSGLIESGFPALRRLDASYNPTDEEFHYAYDGAGRLRAAAFAQTPASGYTPSTGQPYYDGTHLPSSRARAWYAYDAGGRLTSVEHWWDGPSSSTLVAKNQCVYEVSDSGSNRNRGLKTSSTFVMQGANARTETYGYDAANDQLTSANYGDGNPDETPSWTYDAAGNRNDASVVDNLNRATTLGGVACTNDILGNRLTKGGSQYGWDCLNRLLSVSAAFGGGTTLAGSYDYRADGMRVRKWAGFVTTWTRHDGQMPIEDYEVHPSEDAPLDDGLFADEDPWSEAATPVTVLTRYGLGARGVDFIERTTSSGTTTGFPIYDAHGNNVATLSRSGANGYVVNDRRSYDAWGSVRSQQSGGDPRLRYCANLGHKADDESGLIYMRARYYEPTTGRFVSEDPAVQGINWFVYCGNNPLNKIDGSGTEFEDLWPGITALFQKAIDIFKSPRAVATKIRLLKKLIDEMEGYVYRNKIISGALITDAEADEAIAPYEGEAGLLTMRMAELKKDFAMEGFANNAVLKLGMRCVEAMIELLK